MSRLYVGNCTKQVQLFYYVAPERGQRGPVSIPIGGQFMIPEELPDESIDQIIAHHSRYGLVHVDEVSRVVGLTPLCYSVGRPINPEVIERLVKHNSELLTDRGKEIRIQAGLAASEQVNSQLAEMRPNDNIRSYDLGIEEIGGPGNPDPQINEEIKIVRDPAQADAKQKRRGRK